VICVSLLIFLLFLHHIFLIMLSLVCFLSMDSMSRVVDDLFHITCPSKSSKKIAITAASSFQGQ
jgi:hypothetical protein